MRSVVLIALGFLLVALVPVGSASAPASTPTVLGTATSCTNLWTCSYTLHSTLGNGSASSSYYGGLTFQLPGESNATKQVPLMFKSDGVTGNTHWIHGSFVGTDGNTGKAIYGSTDVNVTLTVSCSRGCTTTYKFVNGSIVLHPTHADSTSTAFSCSPSTIANAKSTTCTITVTDLRNASILPKGTVKVQSGTTGVGHFASQGTCKLVRGSCSVKFTSGDEFVGRVTLSADYRGTASYYLSQGTTTLTVT